MRARFFYGCGICFKDKLKDGKNPISDTALTKLERFLCNVGADYGFYQLNGDDFLTLRVLFRFGDFHKILKYGDDVYTKETRCSICGGCFHITERGDGFCPWCGEPKGTCSIPNIDYSISEGLK